MEAWKKNQKGSESRDKFKLLHKAKLPDSQWATDADLVLVEKYPIPFPVAILDFKMPRDGLSFTEAILYQHLSSLPNPYTVPVYLVEAVNDFLNLPENEHRFCVKRVFDMDYRPNPPKYAHKLIADNMTWDQFSEWEQRLRRYRKDQVSKWLQAKKGMAA